MALHKICLTFRTSWSLAGLVDLGVLSGLGSSFKSIGSRFLALIAAFIRAKMSSMNLLYLAISFRPSSIGSKSESKILWNSIILTIYFWKFKSSSFHQYSWSSEVETTWISLIGWPHRTSINYLPYFWPSKQLW